MILFSCSSVYPGGTFATPGAVGGVHTHGLIAVLVGDEGDMVYYELRLESFPNKTLSSQIGCRT
jgi:hypothetical protein